MAGGQIALVETKERAERAQRLTEVRHASAPCAMTKCTPKAANKSRAMGPSENILIVLRSTDYHTSLLCSGNGAVDSLATAVFAEVPLKRTD